MRILTSARQDVKLDLASGSSLDVYLYLPHPPQIYQTTGRASTTFVCSDCEASGPPENGAGGCYVIKLKPL